MTFKMFTHDGSYLVVTFIKSVFIITRYDWETPVKLRTVDDIAILKLFEIRQSMVLKQESGAQLILDEQSILS
jgi:hypothetical protein